MSTNSPLNGKVALITGASQGLGKTMALAIAEGGAHLILIARNRVRLEEVRGEIEQRGGSAQIFPADVTQWERLREIRETVAQKHPKLHILINNAGINIRKAMTEFSLEEWRSVIDANLTSAFMVSNLFVPMMKGQGYGRVINMTSMMSHIALPGRTAYCASKAGLLGFTKALALELAPEQITVNGISPGPFATEINTPILQNPELNHQFVSKIPIGRWGKLEEIGKLVLYLCAEEAGFITGTDIVIDGGWTAQ